MCIRVLAVLLLLILQVVHPLQARDLDASAGEQPSVRYAISVKDIAKRTLDVQVTFPVSTSHTVLYMPVWTPGYYVKEDHKANVVRIQAYDENGSALAIRDPGGNRWEVDTDGVASLSVHYTLSATGRSVSLNEVADTYAVLNGSATYLAAKGSEGLQQVVALSMPSGWISASGMAPEGGPGGNAYTAPSYEALVDSPIMLGELEVLQFTSSGTPHTFVYNRGAVAVDAARVIADLQTVVDETRVFWNEQPWDRYVFLIAFRKAGGGLEHKYSTMVNVDPKRFATPAGYDAFVSLLAHEYQHAFNVKRLRPIELGPFDLEQVPTVSTLWVSEGLTSYYSNLMLRRSGLIDVEKYLGGLSRQISTLQNSPGRLKQSLEQSSREVWSNSLSGIGASSGTVSYYTKGEVLGFLLDARIRRITDGKKSLDDVMRQAYAQFSGDTGFRADQFQAIAEEVAGQSLQDWFSRSVTMAVEVDYAEALNWFGLALETTPADTGKQAWRLTAAADATPEQTARLQAWLE